MKPILKYYAILFVVLTIYLNISKYIFDKVYDTIQIVIDELFHIPQGIAYCERNFTYWDPKITTLPGLYLISSAFIGQHFPCNTYNLRLVNLAASCINLMLFSSILKYVYGNTNYAKTVLQALNLTILPPLYFFSHVYYTDTLSLTFLLAFSRLCLVNRYKILILLFGLMSVMMRQTNIVWIAMVFGHKILDIFIKSSRVFGNHFLSRTKLNSQSLIAKDIDKSMLKRYYSLSDLFVAVMYHITTCSVTFFKYLTLHDMLVLLTHSITLTSFAVFVYKNGSIVLGDKSAHEATLHIPQMLYFLIFYGIFGLPYVLAKFFSTIKLILSNKVKVIIFALLFAAVVHYNTIVHPYLLADNRHFTFYVWNRWFGKYDYAKYATIPAYIFLLFSLYDNLRQQNCVSFLLPYTVSLFLGLCLQQMIEIRYFLIPYIILRLRFNRPSGTVVIFEFLWYLSINAAMYYVFFSKEVMWKDFDYPQRIIW
ncbi:putative Dol-P-Glc:Glc(2)Man(9)GlcNAc(2)-PP-Dol alpha-1,2-glucosyltransferase [Amyelois transitella]|uniref:putative Dol-P-Glc:Glc(2)Man(9)GlcNAc(2)-PP-Dol alpha-1,2-glucosyltransferase n=1 Tax=Amyelois transitella TaxID=680683 RepID=UPI00067BE068|nr:putative Dol-P-Glc:Glc(2)Man(9)GlcNAc(2)-PP-Dol alpha-1,2-glucosyltransferase [Amyelois transitella]XP_013200360.1 putative Dol-P-Glc:Glc(2)Man(9)GlcNAc(2)-PP-Dol alpha-1,2-glucosyltransferase [Amyelois transitella]